MEVPGLRNIGIGVLVCFAGIVVTAVTYSAASGGGHYVVAWGAVVFGAFQVLSGVFQFLKYSASSPMDKALADRSVPFRVLIAALIEAAADGGPLSDDQKARIQAIVSQASDGSISPGTLAAAADAMRRERSGTLRYIGRHRSEVPDSVRTLVVRAGYLVARAEHSHADAMAKVTTLGTALGLSDGTVHAEVDAMLAPEPAQPQSGNIASGAAAPG